MTDDTEWRAEKMLEGENRWAVVEYRNGKLQRFVLVGNLGEERARLIAASKDMQKACDMALAVMADLYDPLWMSEEDHQQAADLADALNAALAKSRPQT